MIVKPHKTIPCVRTDGRTDGRNHKQVVKWQFLLFDFNMTHTRCYLFCKWLSIWQMHVPRRACFRHNFLYYLSGTLALLVQCLVICVFVSSFLSSLVHMSVYVYCSIREKVFPFYYIRVHTVSCFFFAVPSCYIGTGTLLIHQTQL